jgi:hypothetical protein
MALAAAGGTYAAVATSSAASTPPTATAPPAAQGGSATVRIANALVVGKTEAILTIANGLPLYYYAADTADTSLVSGQLYTFTYDRPGQVNGQDFQDFFVVTPEIAPVATSPASTGTVPAAPTGGGYVAS